MFASYIVWHYTGALTSGVRIFQNILIFLFHFFSVPLLTRTLFAKFGRLGEKYKRGFDPVDFFTTLIINTLMRIIGALVRSVIILIGLLSTVVATIVGVVLLLAWILLPLLVFVSSVYGITFLFHV